MLNLPTLEHRSTDNLGKYAVPVAGTSPSSRRQPLPEVPPPSFDVISTSSNSAVAHIDGLPTSSSSSLPSTTGLISRAPLAMPRMSFTVASEPGHGSDEDETQLVSSRRLVDGDSSDEIRPVSPPSSPPTQLRVSYHEKEEEAWRDGERRLSGQTKRNEGSPMTATSLPAQDSAALAVVSKTVFPISPPPSPPHPIASTSSRPAPVFSSEEPYGTFAENDSSSAQDFYSPRVFDPSTTTITTTQSSRTQSHPVLDDFSSPTTPTANSRPLLPIPSTASITDDTTSPLHSNDLMTPRRHASRHSQLSESDSFHTSVSTIRHQRSTSFASSSSSSGQHHPRHSSRRSRASLSSSSSATTFEDALDGGQLHELPDIAISTDLDWNHPDGRSGRGEMDEIQLQTPVDAKMTNS